MRKFNFVLIFGVLTVVAFTTRINAKNLSETSSRKKLPPIRLRTFNINQIKIETRLEQIQKLRQTIQNEIEKRTMIKQQEKIAKEELRRQKIFLEYLFSRHNSSTFLNDFHAERYF